MSRRIQAVKHRKCAAGLAGAHTGLQDRIFQQACKAMQNDQLVLIHSRGIRRWQNGGGGQKYPRVPKWGWGQVFLDIPGPYVYKIA